jgi:Sodium:neurotransmitter symporter family
MLTLIGGSLTLQFILMFKMYDFNRTTYKEYVFPVIWDVLGWSIPLLIVLCIPLTAITKLLQLSSVDSHSSLKQVSTKRSELVCRLYKYRFQIQLVEKDYLTAYL